MDSIESDEDNQPTSVETETKVEDTQTVREEELGTDAEEETPELELD